MSEKDSVESVIQFITTNLFKFVNRQDVHSQKSMLFLIAALGVISTSQSPKSIQSARRLAQLAFQRLPNNSSEGAKNDGK